MKKILFAVCCAVIFAGCSTVNPYMRAKENVENSKRLRVGMTKAEVLAIMGEPLREESFNRPDLWYYYFETNWLDGLITEDECFPLVFSNGKLVGWGNSFYSRYRLESRDRIPAVAVPVQEGAK